MRSGLPRRGSIHHGASVSQATGARTVGGARAGARRSESHERDPRDHAKGDAQRKLSLDGYADLLARLIHAGADGVTTSFEPSSLTLEAWKSADAA